MQTITLKETPHRVYLVGNTYPIREQIRSKGGHWDASEKAWWFGKEKRDVAASLVNTTPQQEASGVDEQTKIRGKVAYKGRTYFLIASTKDGSSHKVCSLDGKLVFWAKTENGAQIVKSYERQGKYGSQCPTLGSLRMYAQNKPSSQSPTKTCWECGHKFTYADAKANGGDWSTGYCGC